MTSRVKFILLSLPAVALASACAPLPSKLEDAQYWQRKNTTSALYLRGPKAQQTLHKDIADCVTEIDELARMAPLREAIPADRQQGPVDESNRYGSDPWESNAVSSKLNRWDTPKRDGYMYAEHFDYNDFEGCMDYKGWERVENLPYEQIKTSRDNYLDAVYGNQYQSRYPQEKEHKADSYEGKGTNVNN